MKRIFATLLAIAFSIACSAQWKQPQQPAQDPDVPAYHSGPPAKDEKLPPILTPDKLAPDNRKLPFQPRAYELAAKVPRVLYQQPCYCFCSKSVGHTSLHSCFESEHGSHCSVCMSEAFYSYKMTKAGKTPAEIRQGIMKGEWKQINLQDAANMQ